MRARHFAAFAVLALIFGCSDPHDAVLASPSETYCAAGVAHGPDRAPSEEAVTSRGCRYDTGMNDVSPSVAITRSGAVFVSKSSAGVQRSTDGGRTWQSIAVPALPNGDAHAGGVHGYVHVDAVSDRVYYLTSGRAASCAHGGAVLSWTDDLGETWDGRTIGCDTHDWGRIVTGAGPNGERAVYYFGVSPRPIGGVRQVFRSLDGGETWSHMARPASVTTESGAGVTAPDGTIYFDYPEFLGYDPGRILDRTYPFEPANLCRLMIAVSEDFGETWRQEAIPGSRACESTIGNQRVAIDTDGVVYAVWTDDKTDQIFLTVSRDKARTWSTPVNVMPPGARFNYSHANIVAREPGHIVIASLNTPEPKNPRWWILPGKGVWRGYMTESFDATSPSPHFTSYDLDAPDDPTMAAGENGTEAQAYMAMSQSGQAWAVFARHGTGTLGAGARIAAGTIQH